MSMPCSSVTTCQECTQGVKGLGLDDKVAKQWRTPNTRTTNAFPHPFWLHSAEKTPHTRGRVRSAGFSRRFAHQQRPLTAHSPASPSVSSYSSTLMSKPSSAANFSSTQRSALFREGLTFMPGPHQLGK